MIQGGSRALVPRGRRACSAACVLAATHLPACLRRPLTWKLRVFSTRVKSRSTGRRASVCLWEHRRATAAPPRNSPPTCPFRLPSVQRPLRPRLSYLLDPSPHALTSWSFQPSPSFPTQAKTPPQAPHRGQLLSEPLYRRCLLLWSRGELLVLVRPLVYALLACDDRCSRGRRCRQPWMRPKGIAGRRTLPECFRGCARRWRC